MKKISKNDVLCLVGLTLIGTGLFFWLGIGQSLSSVGFILLAMGAFGTYDDGKK